MYILTIDLGTTNFKAFLWNKEGKITFKMVFPTSLEEDYSISPFILKNYLEKVFEELKGKKILGISISGMGEAGLLVDSFGNPLTNIFSWLDPRGEKEIKILEELGRDKIFEITGLKISPKYSLAKILWTRKNLKDVWERGYKWLNAVDYLNFLLTGEIVTDFSLGSRMLLLDIEKKNWSLEILNLCNLNASLLPSLKPCGSIIREILPYWQKSYNLPPIPVVLGGHDHPIGSLSLSLNEKTLLDSWGTAEAFFLSTSYPLLSKEVGEKGFSVGYISEDKYYLIAGIHFSGGIRKWVKEKLEWSIPNNFNKPTNIYFFPYILGRNIPSPNPYIRGMFYGINMNTKISDLKRAIWEGIFYESRIIIEELNNLGFNIERIIISGGMTRYKNLIRLKADILNIPLLVSKERELTSKGSAYLVAKNIFSKEIQKNFLTCDFYELTPSEKALDYQKKFQEYKELLEKFFD
jgi:xylulokinase